MKEVFVIKDHYIGYFRGILNESYAFTGSDKDGIEKAHRFDSYPEAVKMVEAFFKYAPQTFPQTIIKISKFYVHVS